MNKKKILCTGTGGFIMGNLVRNAIFNKAPYEFVSIDKICKKSTLNNMYSNKNHTFHIGDIADEHFIDVIFEYEKPDIVLHGAAETFVDDSLKEPNKFIHSNVLGTQVLINAAVKSGIEKFVYLSTDEIYGQLKDDKESSWTEESSPNPRNPYAASKLAGEYLLKAASESFGLNYNITRSSNNYGPRQTPEKLIPKIIKCILEGKKFPIYGKGAQMRDWLHVFDNCAAIMKVVESGKYGETYNISANQEYSNVEVVQLICNAIGKGHDLLEFIEDPRMSHDFRYSISSKKMKELGWEPRWKFKDGIVQCAEWFVNNQFFLK